jgi:hypothetical protein
VCPSSFIDRRRVRRIPHTLHRSKALKHGHCRGRTSSIGAIRRDDGIWIYRLAGSFITFDNDQIASGNRAHQQLRPCAVPHQSPRKIMWSAEGFMSRGKHALIQSARREVAVLLVDVSCAADSPVPKRFLATAPSPPADYCIRRCSDWSGPSAAGEALDQQHRSNQPDQVMRRGLHVTSYVLLVPARESPWTRSFLKYMFIKQHTDRSAHSRIKFRSESICLGLVPLHVTSSGVLVQIHISFHLWLLRPTEIIPD